MKRLALVLSILVVPVIHAQTSDLGMWSTFSINKDFGDRVTASIDQEFRLRDNLGTVNLFYTNFGVSYKPTDFMKVGVTYRFTDKHKNDLSWGIRHRIMTDLVLKIKPGKFNLSYRARFQWEWRGAGYSDKYGTVPEIFMRNLIKVSYKLTDKIEPYIGDELRWQLQNPRIPYHNSIDRTRIFGGVDYEVNKRNKIGAYFLYQVEFNVINPETLHIIGFEYSINL